MALKGHLVAGGLVGPLAGIEGGTANDLTTFDGSGVAHTESLSAYLDRVVSNSPGAILYRGASAWDDLAPADGYLKNTSGVLSWGAVASPPVWKLIEARTVNGDEVFTDLDGYQAILIEVVNVSLANGAIAARVSTDNGSTFSSASGDYYLHGSAGGKTNLTQLSFCNGPIFSAAYSFLKIDGFSLASPKSVQSSFGNSYSIATTTPLNAIQVFGTAGALTSGTIYVSGLPGV